MHNGMNWFNVGNKILSTVAKKHGLSFGEVKVCRRGRPRKGTFVATARKEALVKMIAAGLDNGAIAKFLGFTPRAAQARVYQMGGRA